MSKLGSRINNLRRECVNSYCIDEGLQREFIEIRKEVEEIYKLKVHLPDVIPVYEPSNAEIKQAGIAYLQKIYKREDIDDRFKASIQEICFEFKWILKRLNGKLKKDLCQRLK